MNRYLYVRELLPLINANKDFFLSTISPNPKNLEYFISEHAPEIICKACDDEFEKVPVKNITADIKQNSDNIVLFVEFADDFPKENAQSYAIAIAISPNNEIRLFTYEKGEDYFKGDGTPAYYVGEFDADRNHKNYGKTSEKKISLFSGVIMQELNK